MLNLLLSMSFLGLFLLAHTQRAPITVPPGGDLQAAIERARAGDTILLAPGATYMGNFVLPVKEGEAFITIRTSDDGDGLPRAGQRVSPAHAPHLAKIQSPNGEPSLRTATGAHHWRLQLLEFPATENPFGDIVVLGDGGRAQSTAAQAPREIVIDRCYVHGDPARGQKRGIALNSAATVITNSHISDIKVMGQESQAIAGWNGPGPYTIENNYIEAAGVNFMLGGSDPAIHGLVTADVVFRRNRLAKPIEWRSQKWTVKNLFELKNARRVLVEYNVMEYSWRHAQIGYAILLTPRNQDGRAPWATVEDVTIRYNIIRHAGGGILITGEDSNHPSGSTRRVRIEHNLLYDIDRETWGGNGAFLMVGNGPSDITVEHNTVHQGGNIIVAFGGTKEEPQPILGVTFRNNLVRHNEFGVHGDNRAVGQDSLQTFFPGVVFSTNGIAGGNASRYPGGNYVVSEEQFLEQFVAPASGDFRLKPSSRFRRAASDGRDLGADIAAIQQALGLRNRPSGE